MFTTDRDLLALEPAVFRDISFLAQQPVSTTGSIASGLLTLAAPILAGSGVAPGQVVLINRTPMEIVNVPAADQLVVSLTRADPADPIIVPADRTDVPVLVTSFAPQRALIHSQLLRMLGVQPGIAPGTPDPERVYESQIINPRDLTLVECLGTLHLIYTAAGAALPDTSPHAQRAAMYKQRFNSERWRARAMIDLNNDGHPDTERSLNISHLIRA